MRPCSISSVRGTLSGWQAYPPERWFELCNLTARMVIRLLASEPHYEPHAIAPLLRQIDETELAMHNEIPAQIDQKPDHDEDALLRIVFSFCGHPTLRK